MLLRDLMWDIFLSTGDIGAYMLYRQCLDYQPGTSRTGRE